MRFTMESPRVDEHSDLLTLYESCLLLYGGSDADSHHGCDLEAPMCDEVFDLDFIEDGYRHLPVTDRSSVDLSSTSSVQHNQYLPVMFSPSQKFPPVHNNQAENRPSSFLPTETNSAMSAHNVFQTDSRSSPFLHTETSPNSTMSAHNVFQTDSRSSPFLHTETSPNSTMSAHNVFQTDSRSSPFLHTETSPNSTMSAHNVFQTDSRSSPFLHTETSQNSAMPLHSGFQADSRSSPFSITETSSLSAHKVFQTDSCSSPYSVRETSNSALPTHNGFQAENLRSPFSVRETSPNSAYNGFQAENLPSPFLVLPSETPPLAAQHTHTHTPQLTSEDASPAPTPDNAFALWNAQTRSSPHSAHTHADSFPSHADSFPSHLLSENPASVLHSAYTDRPHTAPEDTRPVPDGVPGFWNSQTHSSPLRGLPRPLSEPEDASISALLNVQTYSSSSSHLGLPRPMSAPEDSALLNVQTYSSSSHRELLRPLSAPEEASISALLNALTRSASLPAGSLSSVDPETDARPSSAEFSKPHLQMASHTAFMSRPNHDSTHYAGRAVGSYQAPAFSASQSRSASSSSASSYSSLTSLSSTSESRLISPSHQFIEGSPDASRVTTPEISAFPILLDQQTGKDDALCQFPCPIQLSHASKHQNLPLVDGMTRNAFTAGHHDASSYLPTNSGASPFLELPQFGGDAATAFQNPSNPFSNSPSSSSSPPDLSPEIPGPVTLMQVKHEMPTLLAHCEVPSPHKQDARTKTSEQKRSELDFAAAFSAAFFGIFKTDPNCNVSAASSADFQNAPKPLPPFSTISRHGLPNSSWSKAGVPQGTPLKPSTFELDVTEMEISSPAEEDMDFSTLFSLKEVVTKLEPLSPYSLQVSHQVPEFDIGSIPCLAPQEGNPVYPFGASFQNSTPAHQNCHFVHVPYTTTMCLSTVNPSYSHSFQPYLEQAHDSSTLATNPPYPQTNPSTPFKEFPEEFDPKLSFSAEVLKASKQEVRKIPKRASKTLPPCRICGEPASGFHYGVNSCEACKGFYRRTLKSHRPHRCRGGRGECAIKGGNPRKLCGYCRYRRCLSLGMSPEAIKPGRYTHTKRTQDTLEVLQLKDHSGSCVLSDREVDRIVEQLVKYDEHVTNSSVLPCDLLSQKSKMVFEEHLASRNKLLGAAEPSVLPKDLYLRVCQETAGVGDVDDRKLFADLLATCVEKHVISLMKFATGIPGFRDLPIRDQIKLLKHGREEFWLVSASGGLDPTSDLDLRSFLTSSSSSWPEKASARRLEEEQELARCESDMVQRLRALGLSQEEMVVLQTMCLLASDRCSLEGAYRVEELQMKMMQCLRTLLKRNHPRSHRVLLVKIMNCVIALRDLTEFSKGQYWWQRPLFRDVLDRHPVLKEMISCSCEVVPVNDSLS